MLLPVCRCDIRKGGKRGKSERKEKVRKCGKGKGKQVKIDCKCDGKVRMAGVYSKARYDKFSVKMRYL